MGLAPGSKPSILMSYVHKGSHTLMGASAHLSAMLKCRNTAHDPLTRSPGGLMMGCELGSKLCSLPFEPMEDIDIK